MTSGGITTRRQLIIIKLFDMITSQFTTISNQLREGKQQSLLGTFKKRTYTEPLSPLVRFGTPLSDPLPPLGAYVLSG